MKPIIFNTEDIWAVLDGLKTKEWRKVKFGKNKPLTGSGYVADGHVIYGSNNIPVAKALWQPGDILYGQEVWQHLYIPERVYIYKADSDGREKLATNWKGEWRAAVHMPKKASRIFLRVTDVQAKKLQADGEWVWVITFEQISREEAERGATA